jgi:hypothetical protein
MAGIGHNRGPELAGQGWRQHCWQVARAELMPTLPIEVVRLRVARARELGLDYRTYAGVRAASGRDVIAFLFSSNALRPDSARRIPVAEAERLVALRSVARIGLAQATVPDVLLAANPGLLDDAHPAPRPFAAFGEVARSLRAALGRMPGDGAVLIASDAPWEAEWLAAGRLAALVPAERFFGRSV